jgi:predicted nucleic acid-binding protein
MILVDTSVWVYHLRGGDEGLATLLTASRVLMHAFVLGELAWRRGFSARSRHRH